MIDLRKKAQMDTSDLAALCRRSKDGNGGIISKVTGGPRQVMKPDYKPNRRGIKVALRETQTCVYVTLT